MRYIAWSYEAASQTVVETMGGAITQAMGIFMGRCRQDAHNH